jgi:hypothetical protein
MHGSFFEVRVYLEQEPQSLNHSPMLIVRIIIRAFFSDLLLRTNPSIRQEYDEWFWRANIFVDLMIDVKSIGAFIPMRETLPVHKITMPYHAESVERWLLSDIVVQERHKLVS